MSAEQILFDALSSDATVVALVGTKVFPNGIPQDKSLPAIAVRRLSTEYVTTIHGGIGRSRATMKVWCVATSQTAAETLATVVITALMVLRYTPADREPDEDGVVGGETFASVLTYLIWE